MIISYTFVSGNTTEVEVSTEIGSVITASRRDEDSAARKERRHCISLDAVQYEGSEFGAPDFTDELFSDTYERSAAVRDAFSHLSDVQKRRIMMLAGGLSEREISRREGRDFKTVHESILAARKKFKKFYR
jgi:DNA-directed RNA polymerase specialized sigma24 family protein